MHCLDNCQCRAGLAEAHHSALPAMQLRSNEVAANVSVVAGTCAGAAAA
jgi:hypothetical protein